MKPGLSQYDMKKVLIVVGILIVIIAGLAYLFIPKYKQYAAETPAINNTYITQFRDGTAKIPVRLLTENRTEPHPKETGLSITDISLNIQTAFKIYGVYNGIVFNRLLMNLNTSYPVMFVSTYMDPNDGIIEGYIVEDIKDGQPTAYVYVDEDWKKQVGDSYVVWGRDYEHMQKFNYTEVAKGIYMNRIQDDNSRFDLFFNNRYGGLVLMNFDSRKNAEGNSTRLIGILLQ